MSRRNVHTVPEALEAGAAAAGGGFTFIRDTRNDATGEGDVTCSLQQLRARACQVAAALTAGGLRRGDRVAIVLPAPEAFVPTFLGVMQAGAIPVPLYPPLVVGGPGGYLGLLRHVLVAAGARILITGGAIVDLLDPLRAACPDLAGVLDESQLVGDAACSPAPRLGPDDTAFLQFTSGSTGRPKGVVVSYANLAANCAAIMEHGLAVGPGDRGVSWLPLHHDMGLIGFVLGPILYRQPVTLLSPGQFVRRPAAWLRTIARHQGTVTFAPNFAYGLAARRIRDVDLAGLDLSTLRVAGCGAEPIHAATLRAFADRFAPYGFRASAFAPSYGMAECTLAISFGHGLQVDRIDRAALAGAGRAVPALVVPGRPDPSGRASPPDRIEEAAAGRVDGRLQEVVGCGRPFPGHLVRVVDPTTRRPLADRRVGEIAVRGPSVTAGYFGDAPATSAVIAGGWLYTGDLGYLAGGDLFLCGRHKDLIVISGRKYYPQDVEWAAASVEGVRDGKVIAFSVVPRGWEREAVIVVVEARQDVPHSWLTTQVRAAVGRGTGLHVDQVVPAESGTLPKTSSGKVQRALARTLYLSGAFSPSPGSESAPTALGEIA